jgi:hypothetical protein
MKCNFCNSLKSKSDLFASPTLNICEPCIAAAEHSFTDNQAQMPRGKTCTLCKDILPIPYPSFSTRIFQKGKFSLCELCTEVVRTQFCERKLNGRQLPS